MSVGLEMVRQLPEQAARGGTPELPPGLRFEGDLGVRAASGQGADAAAAGLRGAAGRRVRRGRGPPGRHACSRSATEGATDAVRQFAEDVAEYLREEAGVTCRQAGDGARSRTRSTSCGTRSRGSKRASRASARGAREAAALRDHRDAPGLAAPPHQCGPHQARPRRGDPRHAAAAPGPLHALPAAVELGAQGPARTACGAPARGAGRARPDLRQVRPDPLDPAGICCRTDIADEFSRLQDRVAPFPGETAKRIIEKALEQDTDEVFAELRCRADGLGLDRAGPCRRAQGWPARGRQGRAAGHRADHPTRPRHPAPDCRSRLPLLARGAAPAAPRGGSRVRAHHPRRAGPAARGGVLLAAAAQTSRTPSCSTCRR